MSFIMSPPCGSCRVQNSHLEFSLFLPARAEKSTGQAIALICNITYFFHLPDGQIYWPLAGVNFGPWVPLCVVAACVMHIVYQFLFFAILFGQASLSSNITQYGFSQGAELNILFHEPRLLFLLHLFLLIYRKIEATVTNNPLQLWSWLLNLSEDSLTSPHLDSNKDRQKREIHFSQ